MALPPERITVKRRLDEDPVDALYLRKKKHRPSAVWRLADKEDVAPAHTQLLRPFNPTNDPPPTVDISILPGPKVPSVRTTTLDEDYDKSGDAISSLFQDRAQDPQSRHQAEKHLPATSFNRPIRHSENSQRPDRASPQLRKFHLSTTRLPTSPPHTSFKSSVRRNRKSQRTDLAIFEESKGKLLESAQALRDQEAECDRPGLKEVGDDETISTIEPPRKKPNATLEERKWRAETWNKPTKPSRSIAAKSKSDRKAGLDSKWDLESLEFAEQLQQIALQEIQVEEQRARVKSSSRQLKPQSKPPRSRQPILRQAADTDRGDVAMADGNVPDVESNYVFDTYIRFQPSTQPLGAGKSTEPHVDPLQGIDYGNFGVIVIDDDDDEKTFWETYGEIQESDPDWNSEEEDENAEDFYGNDYPEDEVSSDDEYGRGAYNYRHDASDDEEFGEETAWSDDDEARPSRSAHRAHTEYGTAN
ncbi:hypothetical protein N7G274_001044 [Stereocaulon virgatum]|uniref:Transcription factor Iwr1 domain-containing protein n=1 Tax=Stereocaulon virgatum TaxID=373712 RepID=A0ABR4AQG5_9LECA